MEINTDASLMVTLSDGSPMLVKIGKAAKLPSKVKALALMCATSTFYACGESFLAKYLEISKINTPTITHEHQIAMDLGFNDRAIEGLVGKLYLEFGSALNNNASDEVAKAGIEKWLTTFYNMGNYPMIMNALRKWQTDVIANLRVNYYSIFKALTGYKISVFIEPQCLHFMIHDGLEDINCQAETHVMHAKEYYDRLVSLIILKIKNNG